MDLRFDPFDPASTQHMWHRFRRFREEAPISRPGDFVFVTRYADVKSILRQPRLFSSAQGFRAPGVVVPLEDKLVGELDPPQHAPIRRLLTSILVPATVEAARPFTRETADAQLDALARRGGGDLVEDLALLLPTQVTVHVLGMPVADAPTLARHAQELLHSTWPATNRTERGEGLAGAFPEYAAYLDRAIAARRGPDAADDFLARLVAKQVFGAPVSDRQLRTLVSNLVLGGISTSTSMLGNLLHHLLTVPEHWRALRGDPALAPAAVEESLRLHPPILYVVRTCLEDTEVCGETLRAGERVLLSLAAANRDDDVYPDADAFRLDRAQPEPHLSFSFGPHLCVGAGLARMVGREVALASVRRFDAGDLSLEAGFAFEPTPVFMEYGPSRLPVVLRRPPARSPAGS